ncbi:unnamed protein product, partial [Trichogramma brassicae]
IRHNLRSLRTSTISSVHTEKPRAYTIFAVTAGTLRSLTSWTILSVYRRSHKH